jgi:hypothetical protein
VQHRLNRKFPAEMDFAHDWSSAVAAEAGYHAEASRGSWSAENGMTHLEFFMQATSVRDVWALPAGGTSSIDASVESSN